MSCVQYIVVYSCQGFNAAISKLLQWDAFDQVSLFGTKYDGAINESALLLQTPGRQVMKCDN
jgi:hypothetical protein